MMLKVLQYDSAFGFAYALYSKKIPHKNKNDAAVPAKKTLLGSPWGQR